MESLEPRPSDESPDSLNSAAISARAPELLRPRLRIAHLLVWTACVALCLGLFRGTIHAVGHEAGDLAFPWAIPTAIALVFAALGAGASLGGLALGVSCHRSGSRFPVYPGEYLVVMRGSSVLLLTMVLGLLAIFGVTDRVRITLIPLLVLFLLVEFFVPLLAASRIAVKPWPVFFFWRGWSFLICIPVLVPFAQLATVIALPILAWKDHRRGRRYPWTHWLGVGLEMWWNLSLLGVALLVLG